MPEAADAAELWQRELTRNAQRMKNFTALVADQEPPPVGCSPRREVYKKHKARLYHYEGSATHRTPVLFVPNLGISRPYIFDLQPKGSFVEYMVGQGFPFYLLDWGVFGPEDNHLTLEDCSTRTLPRMIKRVLEDTGADRLNLVGYCMGAPISACYLGTQPDAPVASFVNMAGPVDFSKAGMFSVWLDAKRFDADRFVDTLGNIPAEVIKTGFKLLKPTMDANTAVNLWWNLWNDDYVRGYKALNLWANDYSAFPGEFFRQWIKDFYQQNRMFNGTLTMAGRRVDLGSIRCPVLVIGAKQDYIAPPDCVKALAGAVGSEDKTYFELPGGHISLIAGRGAAVHCWPKVAAWLAARS